MKLVAKTKIFARSLDDGRELLAYAMDVELDEELAMVLPIPVPPRPAEDAVEFISLEAYPEFFTHLEAAFPTELYASQSKSFGLSRGAPIPKKLVVHDVGRFEASFVPTRADFARLDERFQLPPDAWRDLERYADWGFAVFRLKPRKGFFGGSKRQSVHPMAFSFPRRDPSALFFPTVHVHDGHVRPTASFDHQLFAQPSALADAVCPWTPSEGALGAYVDATRARGLVDGARGGRSTTLLGELPNDDTWLREPTGVTLDDLRGRGDTYEYRAKADWATMLGPPRQERDRAWHETASTALPSVCRALREGVPALCEARRTAWKLAPLTDDLPRHFLNGPNLWQGSSWLDQGGPGTPGGPGRLLFREFTDRVEPQEIELGFAELPDPDRLLEIQRELRALIDRARPA